MSLGDVNIDLICRVVKNLIIVFILVLNGWGEVIVNKLLVKFIGKMLYFLVILREI